MRRRELITLLGGAAAWPFAGFAQTLARPVVGCLVAGSKAGTERVFDGFMQGMRDLGYVEGQNWTFEVRYADGDQARAQSLAEELVRIKPDVLVSGAMAGVVALKKFTDTIPDSLTDTGRSCRLWLCTQSCPAGRQRDRRVVDGRRFAEQTTRTCGRNGSERAQGWSAGEPRQSNA